MLLYLVFAHVKDHVVTDVAVAKNLSIVTEDDVLDVAVEY